MFVHIVLPYIPAIAAACMWSSYLEDYQGSIFSLLPYGIPWGSSHRNWSGMMACIAMLLDQFPDSKVQGANMGPTWVLSAPDGPHVGPMNLAIREGLYLTQVTATHLKIRQP